MSKNINKKLKEKITKAPKGPGVYIFSAKGGPARSWKSILYIGKAANLHNRIRQYFTRKTYGPFIEHLLNEFKNIEFKETDSEIEALILESQLIKKHRPKYNIMLRDDKQYFYVGITRENFPKIFITHQPLKAKRYKIQADFIGPFTDGAALKTTLRLLRRIFPYCTCKQKHNNFCLNYHIGKCPGFCCLKDNAERSRSTAETKIYKKNIRAIKEILSGKRKSLIKKLKKELNIIAKKEEFEKAIDLRNKIEKLERVFENAKIINQNNAKLRIYANTANVLYELKKIFKLSKLPKRIEGYDVSNIQGANATGAMVVFSDGRPDKNEYRKFKIRLKQTPDDIAMLKEVLFRRFNHPEWPFPDLIFIDGGIAQLNAAIAAISNFQFLISNQIPMPKIPIISLAKGKNEVFSTTLKKPVPIENLPNEIQNLILRIDSEAHRFAITYYRKLHRRTIR